MSESTRQATLFYTQSTDDLNYALGTMKRGKHDTCILMCVQASVNCLNAICLSFDRLQNPMYNVTDMLKICSGKYNEFNALKQDCNFMDSIQDYRLFDEHAKGGRRITEKVTENYYRAARRILIKSHALIEKHRLFDTAVTFGDRVRFFIRHRSWKR